MVGRVPSLLTNTGVPGNGFLGTPFCLTSTTPSFGRPAREVSCALLVYSFVKVQLDFP